MKSHIEIILKDKNVMLIHKDEILRVHKQSTGEALIQIWQYGNPTSAKSGHRILNRDKHLVNIIPQTTYEEIKKQLT